MYAVLVTGGKQYRVVQGETLGLKSSMSKLGAM